MALSVGESVRPSVSLQRVAQGLVEIGEDYAWMGAGALPSQSEALRAMEVMAAVPMAAAIGWSVRGHQWSTHPRRLRTAVVRPTDRWDISVMRGVREVDCLAGMVLVRRTHLERLQAADLVEVDSPPVDGAMAPRGPDRDENVRRITRSMRSAGFRLLYIES